MQPNVIVLLHFPEIVCVFKINVLRARMFPNYTCLTILNNFKKEERRQPVLLEFSI